MDAQASEGVAVTDNIQSAKDTLSAIRDSDYDEIESLVPAKLSLQFATVRALIGIAERLDKVLEHLEQIVNKERE